MFSFFKRKRKVIKIKELKGIVCDEMKDLVISRVKQMSQNGAEVCFVAIEYFYDGEAIDIGVRVGSSEERYQLEEKFGKEKDIRKDTGAFKFYEPMLRHDNVKKNGYLLFECMRMAEKDNHGSVYETIKEVARMLTGKLNEIEWQAVANVSRDFIVIEPIEYD